MEIKAILIHRLVKSEDLNHHGTLFAGRGSEWFVEAGFIAAADLTNPENVVCVNVHGMTFLQPVKKGEVIILESKVVLVGKTRLVTYVKISKKDRSLVVDGFLTFVHVDLHGKPTPHGLDELTASNREEAEIINKAKSL